MIPRYFYIYASGSCLRFAVIVNGLGRGLGVLVSFLDLESGG